MTASDFSYDIYSAEDTAAFFSLMQRAGVQQERIDAMKQTRQDFLAANPLGHKEATMFGYTFSCTVHDAIFGSAVKAITIDANSIDEAKTICASQVDVIEVGTLLGTIDRQPQAFLAW